MATATQRAEDADKSAGMGEVTLGQKMLSAVSGSILTSLLGMYMQKLLITRSANSNSNTTRRRSRTATVTRTRLDLRIVATTRLQWRNPHTIPRSTSKYGHICML
jgi:hypothetical protein